MYWIEFTISSALIIAAGVHLTQYADRLSDALKLGKLWIGIVLLGLVTSLPEAITCIAAIIKLGANDLAAGNLLGSNNFNLLLIVLMDLVYREGSITNRISPRRSHNVSGLLSIVLMALVAGEIMLSEVLSSFRVGHVTYSMVLIGFIYFWGMNLLGRLEKEHHVSVDPPDAVYPLPKIWLHLLLSAAVVIFSAIWLTKSADMIALQTGLGRSFVGTILLALVTSLPEMVVTISALRMGAFDLSIGNIFGSNMTNMFIMFICACFYTKGPFLKTVNPVHVLTPLVGILMTFVVLQGIGRKDKRVYGGLGLDSYLLLLMFLAGTGIFYLSR